MKLSINFLKDYIDLDEDIDVKKLAEDMTNAGNEYDEAGKLINASKLVIGEIVECKEHPDSDHLHCCKVNVGKEVLDIVCGAPNARKGIKVIVALDGAQLPGGTIKCGKIRGEVSNGMMCSIAELGLENKFLSEEDKAGIHELPEDAPVVNPMITLPFLNSILYGFLVVDVIKLASNGLEFFNSLSLMNNKRT